MVAEGAAACPGRRAGDHTKMTKGGPQLLSVGGENQGSAKPPGHEDEQHPPP